MVLLAERDMYERRLPEVESRRVPDSIKFVHVDNPDNLDMRHEASRSHAWLNSCAPPKMELILSIDHHGAAASVVWAEP